jgi:hypothetical protein
LDESLCFIHLTPDITFNSPVVPQNQPLIVYLAVKRFKKDLYGVDKTITRTATIHKDENNILHIVMHANVRLDHEDAVDNALVIKSFTKGKKTLKLIDARANFSMDKKAKQFVNTIDVKQTIARAVLKGSLSSLVLSFFTQLSKPETPTKIFSNYDEAYKWLLEFQKRIEDI